MENFPAVVPVAVEIVKPLSVVSREIAADSEMAQVVEPAGCSQLPVQESRSQTDRSLESVVV